jgi:hypothetical protein
VGGGHSSFGPGVNEGGRPRVGVGICVGWVVFVSVGRDVRVGGKVRVLKLVGEAAIPELVAVLVAVGVHGCGVVTIGRDESFAGACVPASGRQPKRIAKITKEEICRKLFLIPLLHPNGTGRSCPESDRDC